MISILRWLANVLFSMVRRHQGIVDVGAGSKIDWRFIRLEKNSSLLVGRDSIFSATTRFERNCGEIVVGDRCFVGRSNFICHTRITIDNDVIISWGVTIVDHNSHSLLAIDRSVDVKNWASGLKDWKNVTCSPVHIKEKAWIGFNVIILKGVTIGCGAIIGAGSVVTKDIPPYCVAAGNPARVIRELSPDER